ncbi:Mitochondrial ATPase complex subunit atp10, partial [Tilletia horrida]
PPGNQQQPQAPSDSQQPPSFTESTSTAAAKAASKPLPFLSTAPGFPFPPAVIANEAPRPSPPSSSSSSAASNIASSSSSAGSTSTSKPAPVDAKKKKAAELRDARLYNERKAIISQATKGYFHDFHSLRAHGGKTWRAPSSLIREERARWWPDWVGKRLSDGAELSTASVLKNKVSLVSVISSKASEEHVRSFTESAIATYATHPQFQHVRLNMQLSALKAFLLRLVFNSVRASIPDPVEQRNYFLCTAAPVIPERALEMELEAARREALGVSEQAESGASGSGASSGTDQVAAVGASRSPGAEAFLRSALCLHNKHVGYVFLVDQRCKVRWAGSAFAESGEREALRTCVGVLLARH